MERLTFLPVLRLVAVTLGVIVIVALPGCDGKTPLDPRENPTDFEYRFTVTHDNQPVAGAAIIGVFDDDSDTLIVCNEDGQAILWTKRPLVAACGAALGLSGVISLFQDGEIGLAIEAIPSDNETAKVLSQQAANYWFGVYSVDATSGDVKFRYQWNFFYFYCSSWLPSTWPFPDPNPNHWTSWNLTDFPYPWKGKKLLVPRTYQWWHKVVYGFPIHQALFLIAGS